MECWCPISGDLYFAGDEFKMEPTVEVPKPIFNVPTRSLLARAKKFGKGNYNQKEETLLFLALFNSTKIVSWDVPATPSYSIVSQYMESMFKLAGWIDQVNEESLVMKLPRYRVTERTSELRNIGVFITACYEVRNEYRSPVLMKMKQDLLEAREATLYKLIHSPKTTEQFAGRLASWAIDATEVKGNEKRLRYTELFKMTPDNGLFSVDAEEFRQMRDFMLAQLYKDGAPGVGASSLQAQKVIEHVTGLFTTASNGYATYLGSTLGGPSSTFQLQALTTEEKVEKIEELEAKKAAMNAPVFEPVVTDYPGRLTDFIRDKARWRLGLLLRRDISAAYEQLDKMDKTIQMDNQVAIGVQS